MENYKKGKNVEQELSQDNIPIENLPEKFLWMHVKGGTKVGNVVSHAEKAFHSGEHRSVVWSGSGGGVSKTISCAEIMKRNFPLHQVTRLNYQKIEEYWEPKMSGLEEIVVSRQIPAIHILLSLDEINPKSLGYQSPNSTTSSFWLGASAKEKPPKQKTDYAYNRNNRNFTKNNRDKNPPNSSGGGKKPRPEKEKKTNSENGNKKQKPDPVDPK